MFYYNNKSIENSVFEKDYNEGKISDLNQLNDLSQKDSKLINLYNDFDLDRVNVDSIIKNLDQYYPNEWLLRFNIYKENAQLDKNWIKKLRIFLSNFQKGSDLNNAINRGLKLIDKKIN